MSRTVIGMGLDLGFRKTGMTVFNVTPEADLLIYAETLTSDHHRGWVVGLDDVQACFALTEKLHHALATYKPDGIFVEIPTGGGQSARATRCMSLATGVLVPVFFYNNKCAFEMYLPVDVEKTLGVYLTTEQKKKHKLKKGELGKWKKKRLRDLVMAEWPEFRGWPLTSELAEDSYDSAAAFLTGRAKNGLYKTLKDMSARPTTKCS